VRHRGSAHALGPAVIYIIGEGRERDIHEQLQAVGAYAAGVDLVDCVVDHPDVLLANMLEHKAIDLRLARADAVIVDPLATFESDGIRKFCIRQRLAPFHRLAQREQHPVTSYFALHTNKSRANIREALDLVPGGWAGNVETCWQIEPSDKLGHAVLEMTRARDHPRPWPAYAFWLAPTDAGVRRAVIGETSQVRIDELLVSNHAAHVPPAVQSAKLWVHGYLGEHGKSLRNDIIAAARVAGHSQPAVVQAKAISRDTIGHTQQGIGPSKWFLIGEIDSVDSVPEPVNKVNQLTRPSGSAEDPLDRHPAADASVIRLADFTAAGSKPNPYPEG
jgi:hypothetical protein